MNSYQGYIFFLLGLLLGMAIFGSLSFFVPEQNTSRLLRCETKDKKLKIGIMLDKTKRILTLEGEVINSGKIKTFSDYLVYAEWNHNSGSTSVRLDRISGVLEMTEKGKFNIDEEYKVFECSHVSQKF